MKEKELIGSIQKAIKVIETFSKDNKIQSLQEITDKTGYGKSTVHRILQTLVYEGWMIQDTYSKRYGLGYGLLGYEELVFVQENLIKVCEPFMRELRDEFNETVTLVVFERDHGRCIHKIESEHHIKLISEVGKPIPLYAGATSKSILAFKSDEYIRKYLNNIELKQFTKYTVTDIEKIIEELHKIRKQGYSTSHSEVDLDTFTVASPVFKKGNKVMGCISVSCPTYRYTEEIEKEMIKSVLDTCKNITSKIKGIDS